MGSDLFTVFIYLYVEGMMCSDLFIVCTSLFADSLMCSDLVFISLYAEGIVYSALLIGFYFLYSEGTMHGWAWSPSQCTPCLKPRRAREWGVPVEKHRGSAIGM